MPGARFSELHQLPCDQFFGDVMRLDDDEEHHEDHDSMDWEEDHDDMPDFDGYRETRDMFNDDDDDDLDEDDCQHYE